MRGVSFDFLQLSLTKARVAHAQLRAPAPAERLDQLLVLEREQSEQASVVAAVAVEHRAQLAEQPASSYAMHAGDTFRDGGHRSGNPVAREARIASQRDGLGDVP